MTPDHPEALEYAAAAPELEKAATPAADFIATVIRIRLAPGRTGPTEYPGWIVPGTEGTLAIDERYEGFTGHEDDPIPSPAVWFITHLPSGAWVNAVAWRAETRARAAQIAQKFFTAGKRIGIDMHATDPKLVAGPVNALLPEERTAFKNAVGAP